MPRIRPATVDDCSAIAEIYRHYVENSVATFDLAPVTVDDWVARLGRITAADRPFIVMDDEDSGSVLGYAYLGVYRGKAAWGHTAEDSIYLRPEASGRGLGKLLLQALLDAADQRVTHSVMAVISDEVPASVALHRSVGFVEVGRTPGVGRKFGRWVGAVYMQYTFASPVDGT